jgi:hypothetical protein
MPGLLGPDRLSSGGEDFLAIGNTRAAELLNDEGHETKLPNGGRLVEGAAKSVGGYVRTGVGRVYG